MKRVTPSLSIVALCLVAVACQSKDTDRLEGRVDKDLDTPTSRIILRPTEESLCWRAARYLA